MILISASIVDALFDFCLSFIASIFFLLTFEDLIRGNSITELEVLLPYKLAYVDCLQMLPKAQAKQVNGFPKLRNL